ncbi:MAG: ABC transporter ATP-binding protein [Verrucomicrobiales bacterium]|nr:ABC transporter ATP-binding protein [Verrucomicrobiales bacterium]
MRVSIRNVSKRFDRTPVLRDISLEIEDRELFFLLGPSGCGKTTLLRLLAGFYPPDAGELWFGEQRMNDVPPHRRNTGMVFQNYALWPHLTVAQNVAYGLEVRRCSAAERRRRVAEALAVVQMEAFAERSPNQLSGGQQQRVALARALVVRPDVLLLDEPLSNLDARLRLEMREEIRRIHDETRITTVYVTHDQKEALSMADRVAVLREGGVEQIGEPRRIYARPATRFVAEFVGETNWLEGRVVGAAGEHGEVETRAGRLQTASPGALTPGQPVWVGFRPEAVRMGPGLPNALTARVRQVTYLGEIEQYRLELADGTPVKAFEQNPQALRRAGDALAVHVRPEDLFVLAVTPTSGR